MSASAGSQAEAIKPWFQLETSNHIVTNSDQPKKRVEDLKRCQNLSSDSNMASAMHIVHTDVSITFIHL